MKRLWGIFAAALVLATVFWAWRWKQDEPRRYSLASLERLDAALHSNSPSALLDTLVMPAALQGRTAAEQTEFLRKALNDEISPEGLAVLKKEGRFGALTNLFPAEGAAWAAQAGVKPEDCVAFRLDRTKGFRAEVVLARFQAPGSPLPATYRIVRCNNVRAANSEHR